MNINEVFRRLNDGIIACNEHINQESDEGKRYHWMGFKNGLEVALDVINEVNHAAADETSPLRRCNGYAEMKGVCTNKVQKQFLILYCHSCNKERLIRSDRPVYNQCNHEIVDEPIIIPFKG